MRVLMFGWEFPAAVSGGLGTACQGLTGGLMKRGVPVLFVVPRMIGERFRALPRMIDGASVSCSQGDLDDMVTRSRIQPVDILLTPYMSEASFRETVRSALEDSGQGVGSNTFQKNWNQYGPDLYAEVLRYGQVARVIARRELFDIIHVHDWMTIPAGIAARDETGLPLIVHIHSLESDRRFLRMDERVYGIERFGMQAADHVIAVSHYTRKKIVDHYGISSKKVSVVHNAVMRSESLSMHSDASSDDRKQVLFLGRLTAQKGLDFFLAAAHKVIAVNRDIDFVIAGDGDLMARAKEAVVRLELGDHIRFTGFLSGFDVEKAYAMSDLYVMPSVSEPFGLTALEAVMCDIPVIISNQSGVSEVMHHCPRVDSWDTDGLAQQMLAILENDTLRDRIVDGCRDELRRLTWAIAADKIIRVYRELLVV